MSYVIVHAVVIVFCLSSTVQCDKTRWLMLGDVVADNGRVPFGIKMDTKKMYFPVSTRASVEYEAKDDKTITGVIAAAVHMKGWVSLLEGGIKSQRVKLLYATESGEPDTFFVLIQSAKRDRVVVEDNAVRSSGYVIVSDSIRNWTKDEVQDALSGIGSNFGLI